MATNKYDDLFQEAAKALERAKSREAKEKAKAGETDDTAAEEGETVPPPVEEADSEAVSADTETPDNSGETEEVPGEPAPENEKAVEEYNKQEDLVKERKTRKKLTPLNMTLITLICLVLTVGAFLIVHMTIGDGKSNDGEKKLPPLMDYSPDDIEYMTITTANDTVTIRKNEDDDFYVQELDSRLKLRDEMLASVVSAAANLSPQSKVTDNCTDWATYGLDNPVSVVFVQFEDGETATYEIGDQIAVGTDGYMRFNGTDALYTIVDYQFKYFKYTLYDFANATIPEINAAAIERCEIQLEDQPMIQIVVDRNDRNEAAPSYTMQKPYNMSADASQVVMFCQSMQAIYINKVYGYVEDLSEYGLDNPRVHVHYVDLDGVEYELFVGNVTKEDDTMTYIAIGDKHCVLGCKNSSLDFLKTDLVNFMDAYVNLIYIGKVEAMRVTDGKTIYDVKIDNKPKLDSKGNVITLANGSLAYDQTIYVNGQLVQTAAFRKVYANIIGIALTARIEDDKFNINEHTPDVTVEFTLNTEPQHLRVDYYQLSLNEYAISRDGSPAVMTANSEHVESIIEAFIQLLNGQLDVDETE